MQAGVGINGLSQGFSKGFEDCFEAMVIFFAAEQLDVKGHAGGIDQCLKEFMKKPCADAACLPFRQLGTPSQVRSAGEVDDDAGECLIEGDASHAEASDPALVAKSFFACLAKRESQILQSMVCVDFEISVTGHVERETSMTCKGVQHMIQERDATLDLVFGTAGPQAEFQLDFGFVRFAFDGGFPVHVRFPSVAYR